MTGGDYEYESLVGDIVAMIVLDVDGYGVIVEQASMDLGAVKCVCRV